jgi:hypothetical protein
VVAAGFANLDFFLGGRDTSGSGQGVTAALDAPVFNLHATFAQRVTADKCAAAVAGVDVGQQFLRRQARDSVAGEIKFQHRLGGNYTPASIAAGDRAAVNGHERVSVALDDHEGDRVAGLERRRYRFGKAAYDGRDSGEEVGGIGGEVVAKDPAVRCAGREDAGAVNVLARGNVINDGANELHVVHVLPLGSDADRVAAVIPVVVPGGGIDGDKPFARDHLAEASSGHVLSAPAAAVEEKDNWQRTVVLFGSLNDVGSFAPVHHEGVGRLNERCVRINGSRGAAVPILLRGGQFSGTDEAVAVFVSGAKDTRCAEFCGRDFAVVVLVESLKTGVLGKGVAAKDQKSERSDEGVKFWSHERSFIIVSLLIHILRESGLPMASITA